METATAITASVLRKRMAARGIRLGDLATASGLYASDVSAILSGGSRLGPKREAKLARGILRLGLDKDTPQPKSSSEPVVIRIRQL